MNKKPDGKQLEDPGRRRVMRWIWGGALLGVCGEFVWLVVSFLRPRPAAAREKSLALFEAGPVETFAPDTVTAFPSARFYLARLEDGGFLALKRECTHLGCALPWSRSRGLFVCPCHASVFDITGEVLQAPAARPLDLHVVRIENGVVRVDLSRTIRRGEFRQSQVARV